jgi:glycerophosphocholine phosphodiesterase GPCPD1
MFRYFVGIVFKPDEEKCTSRQVIVRQWETNINPRVIHKEGLYLMITYAFLTVAWRYLKKEHLVFVAVVSSNQQDVEPDIFGLYDGCKMVDRGWLTTETVVQFKLFENPIQLWKCKYEGRKVQCMDFISFQLFKHCRSKYAE